MGQVSIEFRKQSFDFICLNLNYKRLVATKSLGADEQLAYKSTSYRIVNI